MKRRITKQRRSANPATGGIDHGGGVTGSDAFALGTGDRSRHRTPPVAHACAREAPGSSDRRDTVPLRRGLGLAALALLLVGGDAAADGMDAVLEGLSPIGDFRLRYEGADDRVNRDADALTLRSRVGVRSAGWAGFSGLLEFTDTRVVGSVGDYAPRRPGYAVVADPPLTRLNRAVIEYRDAAGFSAALGRQRIVLDNARFVGNVGWRQTEQVYDALTLRHEGIEGLTLHYTHARKLNGIVEAADASTRDHLFNVSWDGLPNTTLTGYAYLLDNRDSGRSTDTWGARLNGSWPASDALALLYTAEYARQEADLQPRARATYTLLDGGFRWQGVTLRVAQERLGSDGGRYGLQTPYGTRHAFNGWADRFLATPDTGLRDTSLTVGGRVVGVGLTGTYRHFRADTGGARYGREWGLQATHALSERLELGLKYAHYDARGFATNLDRVWLWSALSF